MSHGQDFDEERDQAHGHGHKQSFEEKALRHFDRMADALEQANKVASHAGLERLAQAMQDGFRELRLGLQEDLKHAEERIMASTTEQLTGVKASLVSVATKIDNIKADVGTLNAKITELQNMPPGWTAADQALLDEIQGLGDSILTNTTAVDDLTTGPVFEPVEPQPPVTETAAEKSLRMERNVARNKVPSDLGQGQGYAGETASERAARENRSGQSYPGETAAQRQERERAQREEDQRRNR